MSANSRDWSGLSVRAANVLGNAHSDAVPLDRKEQVRQAIVSGKFRPETALWCGVKTLEEILRWCGAVPPQRWAYHRDATGGFIGSEDGQTQICDFRSGMGDTWGDFIAHAMNRATLKKSWWREKL